MPASYEITFLPEGRVEEFGASRGNYYELGDGSRLDMRLAPVWCRRCGGPTEGEKVESLHEIDKRLAEMEDPASEVYRWMTGYSLSAKDGRGEEFRQSRVRALRLRRRWREQRVSPPRCIACGTTEVVVLEPGRAVPHPAGTGEIVAEVVGMCSTRWNEWYFTAEGERLQKPVHAGLRDEQYISVWLGTFRSGGELEAYLSDPDGFESVSGFGIDPRHPPRFVVAGDGLPEAVAELLSRLPRSDAFAYRATEVARRAGWNRAAAAIAFYGLVYERQYDRSSTHSPVRFLNSFFCPGAG